MVDPLSGSPLLYMTAMTGDQRHLKDQLSSNPSNSFKYKNVDTFNDYEVVCNVIVGNIRLL